MDADADEVSERLPRVVHHLLCLRRILSEYPKNIASSIPRNTESSILNHRVCNADCTEVAASAGERHPRRWGIHALGGEHVVNCISLRRCVRIEKRIVPGGGGDDKGV